ncbi:unnamed protein product [Lactuca saligna]|uniref:Uncharacterized protein n=1 Tax=Lactuca saligna TaxID=75948 RepID=A0AA35YUE2_LACSI|nr:unnamed protein product [Lactuca saligna]
MEKQNSLARFSNRDSILSGVHQKPKDHLEMLEETSLYRMKASTSVTCRLLGVILEESTPHELQNQATVRSSVLDVLLEITKFCDLYLMETVLDDESEKKVLIALENAGIFTSGCCQKAYIHSLFPHLTTHIWHGSQELSE